MDRKRYLEYRYGPPPAVRVHRHGIERERIELEHDYERKVQDQINLARKTKVLSLAMLGLTCLPDEVADLEGLKEIRLDFNPDFSDEGLSEENSVKPGTSGSRSSSASSAFSFIQEGVSSSRSSKRSKSSSRSKRSRQTKSREKKLKQQSSVNSSKGGLQTYL